MPTSLGTFFFQRDHYVNNVLIQGGETREMFSPWTPTADVEPLDTTATASFYAAGPSMGAVIRTQWQQFPVRRPVTYWYQTEPNLWALAGLGAALDPISLSRLGRVE